jgi:hypothetical protein
MQYIYTYTVHNIVLNMCKPAGENGNGPALPFTNDVPLQTSIFSDDFSWFPWHPAATFEDTGG